jgi:hypothetical protein
MELAEDLVLCWAVCYRKINGLLRLVVGKRVLKMRGGRSWLRFVLNGELMFSFLKVRVLLLEI